MKRFMRINILALLIAGLMSSSSFGMWQAARARLATMRPAFTNFVRNSTLFNTLKAKPQRFAQCLKRVDMNKVKFGALITGTASTAVGTGYGLHTMYQFNHPTFTADNINKYDAAFMEYFIQKAIDDIQHDGSAFQALRALLEKYPQSHQRVCDAILQRHAGNVPNITHYALLFEHCPSLRPQLITLFLERDDKQRDDYFVGRLEYIGYPNQSSGQVDFVTDVVNYIIEHPRYISVAGFNKLAKFLDDGVGTVIRFDRGRLKAQAIFTLSATLEAAALKEYGNPGLDDQIEHILRNNPKEKAFNHPNCLFSSNCLFAPTDQRDVINTIEQTSPEELIKLSPNNLHYALCHCTIRNVELQLSFGKISHGVYLPLLEKKEKVIAIIKQQNLPTNLSAQDLITLAMLNAYNGGLRRASKDDPYNSSLGVTLGFIDETSANKFNDHTDNLLAKLSHNNQLDQPYFAYKDAISKQQLLTMVMQNFNHQSVRDLECLYHDVFKTDHERKQIKEAALARFTTRNLTKFGLAPDFICDSFECREQSTITECHACTDGVAKAIRSLQRHKSYTNAAVQTMFDAAHQKQKIEQAKGNYLFVHGRNPAWGFMSDIYKQAYNIVNNDKKIGDDYTFLRFDKHGKSSFTYATDGADALWMNAAIYGNAANPGSCTATYVLNGRDFSGGPGRQGISAQSIFTELELKNYFQSYSKELAELEALYTQANPNKIGNLLAVVVTKSELHRIKSNTLLGNNLQKSWLPWRETIISTKVEAAIKSKKIQDHDAFVLPLTQDYALDPHKGPRIYSFNAADPEKYKEYEQYRDALFAKIAKQVQADKAAAV